MHAKITRLHLEGQGVGKAGTKPVFVWNALPGEEVEYAVVEKNRIREIGVAQEIVKASHARIPAQEDHFLSCSPWQILKPGEEDRMKCALAFDTFKNAKIDVRADDFHIYTDPDRLYGYRNKMEFSFVEGEHGGVSLAFFARGKHYKMPISGCVLAMPEINVAAQKVVEWLNAEHADAHALKSLMLRADGQGNVVAALFIKDRLSFRSAFVLSESLIGFHIYFSDPKSPASVPTELLHSTGTRELESTIHGMPFLYNILGFFQVNVPVFEAALKDMHEFLNNTVKVTDFYSGTGAIGLSLAPALKDVTLVELIEENVHAAALNVERNHLRNVEVVHAAAEASTELIQKDHVLIVDPPRAGLHKDVIAAILGKKPPQVLYLSCNIATQAADVAALLSGYRLVHTQLYNFFPRTPHIESLCVLEKK